MSNRTGTVRTTLCSLTAFALRAAFGWLPTLRSGCADHFVQPARSEAIPCAVRHINHTQHIGYSLAQSVRQKLSLLQYLVSRGATKGTVYYFHDKAPEAEGIDPSDQLLKPFNRNLGRTEHSGQSLEHSGQSLEHSGQSLEQLQSCAQHIRDSKKVDPAVMEQAIIQLCRLGPISVSQLAKQLNRYINTLKNNYIKRMVKAGAINLLYPERPSHPKQAYIASSE